MSQALLQYGWYHFQTWLKGANRFCTGASCTVGLRLAQHVTPLTSAITAMGRVCVQHLIFQLWGEFTIWCKSFGHRNSHYRTGRALNQYPYAISERICLISSQSSSSECMSLFKQSSPKNQFFAVIKVWQIGIIKWAIITPRSIVPNVQMAIGRIYAEYHAVMKRICPPINFWFSVVRMPSSSIASILIGINQCSTAIGTSSPLSNPRSFSDSFWKRHNKHPLLILRSLRHEK